jgi:hypothetical protein
MMTEIKNYDPKQQLRPLQNAHPGLDLARVLARFEGLEKVAKGEKKFARRELMIKLGFQAKVSGAAHTIISAMVHFDLLRKVGSHYVYSDAANKLLATPRNSKEYASLLREIVLSPELYKWLDTEYGPNIPKEAIDVIVRRYKTRNINNKNVKQIIGNYEKSIDFVKTISEQADTDQGKQFPASEDSEYIEVSFRGSTISIYKKYLLEAYQKTRDDELAKLNESLR